VPKSHVRKKKVYTPPAEMRPTETLAAKRKPSPVWVPALSVAFIVIGIAWLVVYYLTAGFADTPALDMLFNLRYWNLAIGFGFMVAALALLSKWR
jgi:hypothetical protein